MKKNLLLFGLFVVLAIAAWWVYQKNTSSTLAGKPLADFAVEDTASITKIFIAEKQGKTALLERIPGKKLWKLNGKYLAREDAMNNLLTTFHRIRVRGNVPQKGAENMLRVIASSGKKVEIYQGGDEPSKIYYIGSSTPDHQGTIMLLEIPGIGRSDEPYITHMEGFTGFLNPRFFADELEWRYTGVYEYPTLDFRQVEILFPARPENSLQVQYKGGDDIQLYGGMNPVSGAFVQRIERFDTVAVHDLLLAFKKVHFESYRTFLRPEAEDSIRKTIPLVSIRLTDKNGVVHPVDLYPKRAKEPKVLPDGTVTPWDQEYFWGRNEENYLGLAQLFTFNPIIQPLGRYTGELTDPIYGTALIP